MKKTDLKKNSAKSFSSAMIGQNFFNTTEGMLHGSRMSRSRGRFGSRNLDQFC
ncbi:UNVERIFIED_CONTAM: hypothetical protein MX611_12750 [Staphylococcus haemolyticus]